MLSWKNYVTFGIQTISQLFWHCDIISVTLLFGNELDLWHQHPFSRPTRGILMSLHFLFLFPRNVNVSLDEVVYV